MRKALYIVTRLFLTGASILFLIVIIGYPAFLAFKHFKSEVSPYHLLSALAVAMFIGLLTTWKYITPLNIAAELILTMYSSFYTELFRLGSRYFAKSNKNNPFEKVVEITISNDIKLLGFLTNSIGDKRIVFIPTSRRLTSGINLIVSSSTVEPIDITTEDFLKFIVTSGAYKLGAII